MRLTGDLNVIIETPRGSRNKFDFDEEYKLFKLVKVLPEGMVFPFEFGFIPSTRGDDGDLSTYLYTNGRSDDDGLHVNRSSDWRDRRGSNEHGPHRS